MDEICSIFDLSVVMYDLEDDVNYWLFLCSVICLATFLISLLIMVVFETVVFIYKASEFIVLASVIIGLLVFLPLLWRSWRKYRADSGSQSSGSIDEEGYNSMDSEPITDSQVRAILIDELSERVSYHNQENFHLIQ